MAALEERSGKRAVLTDDGVWPSWQLGYRGGVGSLRTLSGWARFAQHRARSFRSRLNLGELSGALGDMGTLVPLLVACAKVGSIRLGPAMLWMGIFNVISAIQWDIPMPVQPMKSIAAVAISDGMTPGTFAASGIISGGVVWILGITRLIDCANMLIPKCVIAGIQIGLGIKMASKGCSYWTSGGWTDLDGKATFLVCFVAGAFMLIRTKLPAALVVFGFGVVVAIVHMVEAGARPLSEGLQLQIIVPTAEEWLHGLTEGALPQLPLSIMNSVIAVCALSVDLFRDPADGGKGVTRASVASSVGLMNLVGCWFGAMPSCHGAGGLAGQYRFGARGGCSILMLGIAKIILALVFGQSVDVMIIHFPKVVLGVLLLFAGVELASVGAKSIARSPKLEEDLMTCFVTAGAYIGGENMALGVSAGLIIAVVQRWEVLQLWCLSHIGSIRSKTPPGATAPGVAVDEAAASPSSLAGGGVGSTSQF